MTLTYATVIAGIVAMLSPLALRYVKLDGLQMAAVSYLLALVITIVAGLISGEFHFDRASLLTVLGGSAGFWSVQQGIYRLLKEKMPTALQPQSLLRASPVPAGGSGGGGG